MKTPSAIERLWRVIWAATCLGAGCSDPQETSARTSPCREACWADPVVHWVCEDECRSNADCPGGFVCLEQERSEHGICGPPVGIHTSRAALIDGFEVEEMKGKLETFELPTGDAQAEGASAGEAEFSGGAELTWEAPEGATVVHCALFVCAPVIVDRRIINYEQCVVAEQTSTQSEGAFSLNDEEHLRPIPARAGTCGAATAPRVDTAGKFPVTELLAGCWAYDEADLIAATSLGRPAPDEIFNYHGIVVEQCASGDDEYDGSSCLGEDGAFGVCTGGRCARRCLRDDDCRDPDDLEPDPMDVAGACEPLPEPYDDHRACRPEPELVGTSTGGSPEGTTSTGNAGTSTGDLG